MLLFSFNSGFLKSICFYNSYLQYHSTTNMYFPLKIFSSASWHYSNLKLKSFILYNCSIFLRLLLCFLITNSSVIFFLSLTLIFTHASPSLHLSIFLHSNPSSFSTLFSPYNLFRFSPSCFVAPLQFGIIFIFMIDLFLATSWH